MSGPQKLAPATCFNKEVIEVKIYLYPLCRNSFTLRKDLVTHDENSFVGINYICQVLSMNCHRQLIIIQSARTYKSVEKYDFILSMVPDPAFSGTENSSFLFKEVTCPSSAEPMQFPLDIAS